MYTGVIDSVVDTCFIKVNWTWLQSVSQSIKHL